MTKDEEKIVEAALEYVDRSLGQRRRSRDRPSQLVLEGLALLIRTRYDLTFRNSSEEEDSP